MFYSSRRDRLHCSSSLRTQKFLSPIKNKILKELMVPLRIHKKGNLKKKIIFSEEEKKCWPFDLCGRKGSPQPKLTYLTEICGLY
jgi:hypothetical protein